MYCISKVFMERFISLLPIFSCLLFSTTILQTSCSEWRDCSEVDVSNVETLPMLLSETGLYSDTATKTVSESAFEFKPQFPLWTDGAKKQRWLILPEGTQIDTQDEDNWVFPVGTKFFKNFTRDDILIETRLNEKTDNGWIAATYLWNEAGNDAERQLEAISDASGTPHDIPSAAECSSCHGGRSDFTLGFSATQLDLATRTELYTMGAFTQTSEAEIQLTETEKAGLGVLHGNCSHCHNETRNDHPQATDCYDPSAEEDFDLTLPANLSSIKDAPVLLTGRHEFLKGNIIKRMSHRNKLSHSVFMPPLGTEEVDDEGVKAVQALMDELN